ncbi:hypothetical protein Taro_023872 [Colocasia esculenta]|uniref:Retrotransposon gag domain-containing protein n=1 Tax=Colocasia esculenta TaxID=4460 RepID=A0A843UYM9_COLES|nr:hypothetical protein [Colocasia esculenta]
MSQAQAPTPVPQEHGHGGPSIMERFKRTAPPSFKGESQPLLAESWMRVVEKIFRAIKWAEEDKVSLVTYMLPGSMTVLEYDARFAELSKYAPHIVADERRKTMKFVMGLKPSLRSRFNNELGSFGGRLELLRRWRKAGNPELDPLPPLLCPERRLVLDLPKGTLVSTLLEVVSTHCPKTAQMMFWEGLQCRHYLSKCRHTVPVDPEGSDEEPVELDGTGQD